MKQCPQLIMADSLLNSHESRPVMSIGGFPIWVVARPLSIGGLWTRIKLGWGVFTGKWDALAYIEDSPGDDLDFLSTKFRKGLGLPKEFLDGAPQSGASLEVTQRSIAFNMKQQIRQDLFDKKVLDPLREFVTKHGGTQT